MENELYEENLQVLKKLLSYGSKTTNLANKLLEMLTEDSKRKFLNQDRSGSKYDKYDCRYYYKLQDLNDKKIKATIYFDDEMFHNATSLEFRTGDDYKYKYLDIGFYPNDATAQLYMDKDRDDSKKIEEFKNAYDAINDFEKQNGRLAFCDVFMEYVERKKVNGYASLYSVHTEELLKTTGTNKYVILSFDREWKYFDLSEEETFEIKNFKIEPLEHEKQRSI